MKKQAYIFITTIMLLIAGVSSAKAQTAPNPELIAKIPFSFSVGDKTMAAGEYSVHCVNPGSSVKVLQFRSEDGNVSVLVSTNSVNGSVQDNARLVFYRYGDQYFFAQAWMPADGIGLQTRKSEAAKARELAHEKRNDITVVASMRR